MTDREKLLEEMLRQAWALFHDAYLQGERPDDVKRQRAFIALDRKLREEKVIGSDR